MSRPGTVIAPNRRQSSIAMRQRTFGPSFPLKRSVSKTAGKPVAGSNPTVATSISSPTSTSRRATFASMGSQTKPGIRDQQEGNMSASHSIGCIAPWSTRGPVSALFRNLVMPRPSTYASSTFITVIGPRRMNMSETRSLPGRSQMVFAKGSQGSGRSRNRPEPSIAAVPTSGTLSG